MNDTLFRILRGFGGLTQTELGEILGKSQPTIACYEIGTVKIPVKVASEMEMLVKEIGITDFDILLLQQLINSNANAKAITKTTIKAGESQ